MRVVYFGTSDFAVPALERLTQHVVLVVTQPDRPSGRGMELRPSAVKQAALRLGLQVETPVKSRKPEFVERLASLQPDLFVVASYGQILSRALLDVPKHGSVNLHASVLPHFRGAAPIQYALLNGECETGVTVMMMDEGMDTGDIVASATIEIGKEETAGDLHDRLADLAAALAAEWVPKIAQGSFPRTPQDDEQATYAPKVTKQDAQLRFDRPAKAEFDRYRAFTPHPGAFLALPSGTLRVHRARLGQGGASPGTVLAVRPDLEVAFADGSLVLDKVQPQGRKAMGGSDFANGARIAAGDCLLL
ncbi:MAG TPA: methionyl-tRNA formyltransferase [Fimbriimonadaceae bacterium]|nr:methionyl-tRNA formyltransferase [Fimbriimonadaceae bacterium]